MMAGKVAERELANWNEANSIANNVSDSDTFNEASLTTVQVTTTLAFTIGLVHVLMGLLQFSFIATYFSDQLVAGFTTAASIHVLVAQLRSVLAIPNLPRRSGFAQLFLVRFRTRRIS
ncbi:unnamed protein product [Gongylonema pulchrum]|uniref:SLC26A/SulP transporter domain-containing protein n=1 Tax=Gongylonema pulchrum TaxID=637853 RepID=A0A3P6R865_9BILA|nr:unnamed protein product [Gongylonema pulchrum]